MAKTVSPGVQALRDVVEKVYRELREAKEAGEPVGWSSSKFPCELAESFGLHVGYPENQAAGIAANRDGEVMCQAAEDLGYDSLPEPCGVIPECTIHCSLTCISDDVGNEAEHTDEETGNHGVFTCLWSNLLEEDTHCKYSYHGWCQK